MEKSIVRVLRRHFPLFGPRHIESNIQMRRWEGCFLENVNPFLFQSVSMDEKKGANIIGNSRICRFFKT